MNTFVSLNFSNPGANGWDFQYKLDYSNLAYGGGCYEFHFKVFYVSG